MGLVLEVLHGTAVSLVAHDAGEDDHPARARVIDLARDRVRGQRVLDHAEDVAVRPAAHGRKERQLIIRVQMMIGLDVVVADGEQREWTIGRENGMTPDDRRPRGLDRSSLGNLDVEPLLPGGFSIPGKEADPDSHVTALRSGGTDRSRSWTSRSGS